MGQRSGCWWYRAAAWIGIGLASVARGDEPAEAFLQALRDRGHFDLAEAYLETMQTSPLAPDSFRRTIPFERAETIIQSVSQLRDINQWEARLAEAEKLLQQYTNQADTPSSKAKAIEALANLKFRQSRVYVVRADNDRLTAEEREAHLARARQLMQDAIRSYEEARETLKVIIEKLAESGDTSEEARRQLEPMRNTFLQVRLRIPIARESLADTFAADSLERRDLLNAALTDYLDMWDKFYKRPQGTDAGLAAARCRRKLGKIDEALSLLEDFFQQRDTAAMRPLKREAALIAIDCWREKSPYPADAVVERLEPLINGLARADAGHSGWQRLQLELAFALAQKAAQMQAQNRGTPTEISTLRRRAVSMARQVARAPGPHRDEAKKLLDSWNAGLTDEADVSEEITTLAAARDRLVELIVEAEALFRQINDAEQKVDVESLQAELESAAGKALAMAQTALRFTTDETDRRDINHIRFLQAYAYFMQKRYYEVAVISQFMLDKYSGVDHSRQAGLLLVNSLARLFEEADEASRAAAQQRLERAASRVIELYAGSPESDQAAAVLTRLAIQRRDLAAAQAHLQQMSPHSSGRTLLGLQLSQQWWLEYRATRGQLSPQEWQDRREEMMAQLEQVRRMLADSLAGITPADATFEAALAALFLASAHLEAGDLAAAVAQLEEAPVAPLDLIKQRRRAIFDSPRADQFLREAYRTALNVYLANLRSGTNTQMWLDKSQAVLVALRQQLESQAGVDVNREMASIYALLATEIKEQFAGPLQPAERENLARNLAQFLGDLAKQAGDTRTLMWVGATLLETAEALVAVTSRENSTAGNLYRQAYEVLERVEQVGFGNDPQREARELELQRVKALVLRGLGNFEQSVKVFASILEKRPSLVPLQLEAARTLKDWGAATRSANAYGLAMMGTEPRTDPNNARNRRNVIWGYRQLVMALRDDERLREAFFEAYYHLIESRLEYGLLLPSAEAIQSAQTELANLRARDAALGGPNWRPRFEKLESRIKENLQ